MLELLIRLWTLPTTLPGLVAAGLARLTGGTMQRVDGVLEVSGGLPARWLRFLGVAAMTLGDVVLARDEAAHVLSRSHERIHVRQVRRWGPLFYPAYGIESLIAWARGGHYYYDNRFEREAYGVDVAAGAADPALMDDKEKPQAPGLRQENRDT